MKSSIHRLPVFSAGERNGSLGYRVLSASPKGFHFAVQNRAIFTVDRHVLQCYKPLKDKLFGGESPNELPKSSTRVRPQTCLAGQAC